MKFWKLHRSIMEASEEQQHRVLRSHAGVGRLLLEVGVGREVKVRGAQIDGPVSEEGGGE